MNLTDAQKRQLYKENVEQLKLLLLWEKTKLDIEKTLKDKIAQVDEVVGNYIQNIKKGEKGDPGIDGIDGEKPTEKELLSLIKPLIPNVKNGVDGKDGKTPTKKELLQLITPLIPKETSTDAIIEIVLTRLNTMLTLKTDDLKNDILKEIRSTPITIENIIGLSEEFGKVRNQMAILDNNIKTVKSRKEKGGGTGGGGMGNWRTDDFTGDDSTTIFALSNKVASNGTAIVVLLNGQVQEQGTHYSVSGSTLTFTTAPFTGAAIHAWYTRT